MPVPTLNAYIDWDQSGSFTDLAAKDVTSKIKEISWNRGRSSAFQRYVAGQCELRVRNATGDFSPENPTNTYRTTLTNFETAGDTDQTLNATTQQRLGQGFQVTTARAMDRCSLYLKRTGAPGGTLTVTVYVNNAGVPGAAIDSYSTSRTVTASGIGTSYEWVNFSFELPPLLTPSTTYHLVLQGGGGYTYSAGNQIDWSTNTGGYASGVANKYDGTSWSAVSPATDFKFRVSSNDVELGRPLWVTMTYSGTTYPMFYGLLRSINPNADRLAQEAYLLFEDPFPTFANKEVRLPIQTGYAVAHDTASPASAIYDVCVTTLGLSANQHSIGTDLSALPYWYQEPHACAMEVLEALAESVAGTHYMKAAAAPDHYKYVFRSWTADQVESAAALSSLGTSYRDDFLFRVDDRDSLMANRVIARSNPRAAGVAGTVVWTYGQTSETWGASESRTIWAELSDPCTAIVTPASGTDYTAGFTVTVTNTYSQMLKLTVTSPAGGGTLNLLQIRGTPAELQDQNTVIQESSESQTIYGIKEHAVDNIYVQTQQRAESIAARLLRRHRRNFPEPQLSVQNLWPDTLSLEIGNRVSVTLPTGVAGASPPTNDYYIEGMEHRITVANVDTMVHGVRYRLRKALGSTDFWTLDSGPGLNAGVLSP